MLHKICLFALCALFPPVFANNVSIISSNLGHTDTKLAVEQTAPLRSAYLQQLAKNFMLIDEPSPLVVNTMNATGPGMREFGQGSTTITIDGVSHRVHVVFGNIVRSGCASRMQFIAIPYLKDNILYSSTQIDQEAPSTIVFRGAICPYTLNETGSDPATYRLIDSSTEITHCSLSSSNIDTLTRNLASDDTFTPLNSISVGGADSAATDFCALFDNKVINSGTS